MFMQMSRYFFSFSRNVFGSETVHLLLRIIIESFKQHYFFLTGVVKTRVRVTPRVRVRGRVRVRVRLEGEGRG